MFVGFLLDLGGGEYLGSDARLLIVHDLGNAKVGQKEAVAPVQDVCGLDVAVDDAWGVVVDVIYGAQDLAEHPVGCHGYIQRRLLPLAIYQVLEAAVVDGHEDFDLLALEPLGMQVWYDVGLARAELRSGTLSRDGVGGNLRVETA